VSRPQGFRIEPPTYRPVAVVDIGSNSVRLVVYDGLRRAPAPIFNEKVLCGLGRGVALKGRLAEEGMARAIPALKRFRALARQMGAKQVFAVATAAVREAKNGEDFVEQAEQALGAHIDVLTGKEEARYAALGVLAGIPGADGVAGDLGGGSLELITISDGRTRDGLTLPIGPLRLIDLSGGSIEAARHIIDDYLAGAGIVEQLKGRTLYAVGGTWRNLAKLHMAQNRYPLHVLHGYRFARQQALPLSTLVAGLSATSLRNIREVSRSRADTMPFGALVLERLLELGRPRDIEVSVYGVREGLLYSKLPRRKRDADSLLASCWDYARRYARSPEHELELCDWTDQLFGSGGIRESVAERRLRHAACLLADIGWRAHPDYRAERSLSMISQAAFVGVDHPGRVFLALTVFYRYDGDTEADGLARMLDDETHQRAHLLSSLFRLAYILSAAMPRLLPKIGLRLGEGKTLILTLPRKLADLAGERVDKRLAALAHEIGRTGKVELR
jgi:exopolyphosphatase/guanosine-5'-triphosphate,3'-diphosphate pyrophosphatase